RRHTRFSRDWSSDVCSSDLYVKNYKDLISRSKFFKESAKNTFGTYQANEIVKSIQDNSFFEAGHKFVLDDGTEINDSEQLRKIVQEEIQKILKDRKSTRLNSSHVKISYAVFCLKKKT